MTQLIMHSLVLDTALYTQNAQPYSTDSTLFNTHSIRDKTLMKDTLVFLFIREINSSTSLFDCKKL